MEWDEVSKDGDEASDRSNEAGRQIDQPRKVQWSNKYVHKA